jgi:hypothetical protein
MEIEIIEEIPSTKSEWLANRWGKITGSIVKGLKVKPRKPTVIGEHTLNETELEILAERLSSFDQRLGKDYFNAMERGLFLEPEAIARINKALKKHKIYRWNDCLVVNSKIDAACSPDGLSIEQPDDTTIVGHKAVEKAVYAYEGKCLSPKEHLRNYFLEPEKVDYYDQVIQYFAVMPKLKVVILHFYNPEMRKDLQSYYKLYHRKEHQEQIVERLNVIDQLNLKLVAVKDSIS